MPIRRSLALLSICWLPLAGCETTPDADASPDGTSKVAATAGGPVTEIDGFSLVHNDWARIGYRWDWSARPFLSSRGTVRSVVPDGDMIFVQDTGSVLSAMNASTGRLEWSSRLGSASTSFPGNTPDGDRLLTPTGVEFVELDRDTGNIVASSDLEFIINTAPALTGDIAVLGSANGRLLGHHRLLGLTSWAYELRGPISVAPVAVDTAHAIAVSDIGDVMLVDTSSGQAQWRTRVSGGFEHPPLIDRERVFVASLDRSLYAFDLTAGSRAWRLRTERPLDEPGLLYADSLIIELGGRGLASIDRATGEVLWENPELTGRALTADGDALIVWNGETLWRVDAERGDIIERAAVPGIRSITSDGGNSLIAVTDTDRLLRFSLR